MKIADGVLKEIEEELERANKMWRIPGREAVEKQYDFWAPHVVLLSEKLSRLRSIWYDSAQEQDIRPEIVKMAAIAIRALMEVKDHDR